MRALFDLGLEIGAAAMGLHKHLQVEVNRLG